MAGDIATTAAKVGACFPTKAEIFDMIANETITIGQAVSVTTGGKAQVADANDAAHQQFRGIALTGGGAGQAISVLKKGHCYGFTLSGSNADALIYLSDTAGILSDTVGTLTVNIGRVVCLPDADLTKVLYVEADWLRTWA